ncbi:CHAT domain-containing protein [Achaetomium macrosporum]|uniref:CHAT domain-containing protein n=1 Tax=Achaetomium macrosporum TaxID=79813 RepID=A0AAN7C2C9_9PEZI|nr:CHAT domain-containing protein [Achaetomium macrosporum]
MSSSQDPIAATELLETGRGVIAAALFEQSDVSALKSQDPELARSFDDLRNQLDAPASAGSLGIADRPTTAVEAEGGRRREAEQQLTGLLETIRSKPGFERFLLSASEADMLGSAQHGPIVVLNVSSYRCDALTIQKSGIRLLELPRLSLKAINDHVRDLGSLETLGWLWDDIVCPVLDALRFTSPPSDGRWPHGWWVPTGPLTRFPLHAAGYHLRRSGETALDRAVSSYAPSIKAIMHSRRRPAAPVPESQYAVILSMEFTKDQKQPEFASQEAREVLDMCKSMGIPPYQLQSHKRRDVSSALEACRIFHFAGHDGTDSTEPLQSQLLLDDWEQDPFTVERLLEINLTLKPPFLAYLSACGTGQILEDRSVDESIHLASAFQLAGFRHVVGTLWSVDDGLCVDMARMTYEYLRDKGMADESVSRGLHRATRTLRDEWVDGEGDARRGKCQSSGARRDAALDITLERRQPLWVPYVHFGV